MQWFAYVIGQFQTCRFIIVYWVKRISICWAKQDQINYFLTLIYCVTNFMAKNWISRLPGRAIGKFILVAQIWKPVSSSDRAPLKHSLWCILLMIIIHVLYFLYIYIIIMYLKATKVTTDTCFVPTMLWSILIHISYWNLPSTMAS